MDESWIEQCPTRYTLCQPQGFFTPPRLNLKSEFKKIHKPFSWQYRGSLLVRFWDLETQNVVVHKVNSTYMNLLIRYPPSTYDLIIYLLKICTCGNGTSGDRTSGGLPVQWNLNSRKISTPKFTYIRHFFWPTGLQIQYINLSYNKQLSKERKNGVS